MSVLLPVQVEKIIEQTWPRKGKKERKKEEKGESKARRDLKLTVALVLRTGDGDKKVNVILCWRWRRFSRCHSLSSR